MCDEQGRLLINASSSSPVPVLAATATPYSINDAATSQILANANPGRLGFIIENDSIYFLYVKFGATASLTSYTVKLTPQGYYEMSEPIYTGNIDGIWSGDGTGAARITELT